MTSSSEAEEATLVNSARPRRSNGNARRSGGGNERPSTRGRGPASGRGTTRRERSSSDFDITGLAAKRRKEDIERNKANYDEIVNDLQALLDKAKRLKRIDGASMASIVPIKASLDDALDRAKERLALIDYIPSLKKHFDTICFDSVSEDQLCDMVWAFRSLDIYRVGQHADDDCMIPSLFKVLHVLERKAREGNYEEFSRRWTNAHLDKFWEQEY